MRTTKGKTYKEAYLFREPISAHLAAQKEGVTIGDIQVPNHEGLLVIEGTGGIFSPLSFEKTWLDAAKEWRGSWLLVHRHYLGCYNHFFLTVEALQQRGIPLFGIVFNGQEDQKTEEMLVRKAKARCLGRIPWQDKISKTDIQELAREWKPRLGL
jgi:dethiobiotin synthetase